MVIMKAGHVNIMSASEMPERFMKYNPEGELESEGSKID